MSTFLRFFDQIYPKLKSNSKSRNLKILCTAIFVLECKKFCLDFSLKGLLSVFDVKLWDYFRTLREIEGFGSEITEISPEEVQTFTFRLISRLVDEYQLKKEVKDAAYRIAVDNWDNLGEKPQIIAGSAVGVALKIHPPELKISKFKIAKSLKVSASTIYTKVNSININQFSKI